MKKNSQRIWIEQLLLLIVRISILLLFALAIADPVMNWFALLGGSSASGGQTHLVLVVDGSYSMDFRIGERSLFDQARDAAVKLVEQSSQGDGFSVVLMADPPQAIIAQPTFDPNVAIDELRNLRLPHGGASLAATMGEVEAIVRQTSQQNGRLTKHRVCLFTDLGKSTWDEATEPTCRARIAKLGENSVLSIFEMRSSLAANAAITRLATRETLVTAGREVQLEVDLQNFGTEELTARKIDFLVDGQKIGERPVDLMGGGRASLTISHRFETAGDHTVEAVFQDDPLRIDNHRWFVVPVKEYVHVLCVQGQPEEAHYVALALNPSKSDRPRVRTEVAAESVILESDLRSYDCVFLCNVGRFSHDEGGVLRDYLRGGGGLVFFLGDQVQAESYNLELGGEGKHVPVLPARLEKTVSEPQYRFDPRGYRHPIVAPFRDQTRAGLLTTPVWKYFRLVPYDTEHAKVALAFDNGDPVIVDQPILRGRSVLFATACSTVSLDRAATPPTPWTPLPTWPSFLPLIQETLALAVRGQHSAKNVQVGETIQGTIPISNASTAILVGGHSHTDGTFGEGERVRLVDDGEDRRWTFGSTLFSGVYRADYSAAQNSPAYYSVNVDTRESQLDRLDAEALPSQFHRTVQSTEAASASPTGAEGRPLFRYLLSAVFVLLLTESTLAWYFGNRWSK